MSKTAQIILDQMVLVKVDATIYGARKKLKVEDLMLVDGSKLPPEDLASLGSKRLLDPDQLSVFNRLKKEAERICLRIGTRFLGGYAIPCTAAPRSLPNWSGSHWILPLQKPSFWPAMMRRSRIG